MDVGWWAKSRVLVRVSVRGMEGSADEEASVRVGARTLEKDVLLACEEEDVGLGCICEEDVGGRGAPFAWVGVCAWRSTGRGLIVDSRFVSFGGLFDGFNLGPARLGGSMRFPCCTES